MINEWGQNYKKKYIYSLYSIENLIIKSLETNQNKRALIER